MADPRIGTRFGSYEIVEVLGQGAMGCVYRAVQHPLRRVVALKLLKWTDEDDPRTIGRFLREAKLASSVQHPNLVTILDGGQVDQTPYLAMELVRGSTLTAVLEDSGPLFWTKAARIMAVVSDGLSALHEQGIIHRDLKLCNVMLCDTNVPKILDFGLARRDDSTLGPDGAAWVSSSWRADCRSRGSRTLVVHSSSVLRGRSGPRRRDRCLHRGVSRGCRSSSTRRTGSGRKIRHRRTVRRSAGWADGPRDRPAAGAGGRGESRTGG